MLQESALTTLRVPIDNDPTWKRALRFANEEQKQRYMGYAKKINANEAYDKEQKKKRIELEEKKKQMSKRFRQCTKKIIRRRC
mgnify:CR=1 FL=1